MICAQTVVRSKHFDSSGGVSNRGSRKAVSRSCYVAGHQREDPGQKRKAPAAELNKSANEAEVHSPRRQDPEHGMVCQRRLLQAKLRCVEGPEKASMLTVAAMRCCMQCVDMPAGSCHITCDSRNMDWATGRLADERHFCHFSPGPHGAPAHAALGEHSHRTGGMTAALA